MDMIVRRRQALLAAQRHHEEPKRPAAEPTSRTEAEDDKLVDVVGTSDTPLHPLHPGHHMAGHHHPGETADSLEYTRAEQKMLQTYLS